MNSMMGAIGRFFSDLSRRFGEWRATHDAHGPSAQLATSPAEDEGETIDLLRGDTLTSAQSPTPARR